MTSSLRMSADCGRPCCLQRAGCRKPWPRPPKGGLWRRRIRPSARRSGRRWRRRCRQLLKTTSGCRRRCTRAGLLRGGPRPWPVRDGSVMETRCASSRRRRGDWSRRGFGGARSWLRSARGSSDAGPHSPPPWRRSPPPSRPLRHRRRGRAARIRPRRCHLASHGWRRAWARRRRSPAVAQRRRPSSKSVRRSPSSMQAHPPRRLAARPQSRRAGRWRMYSRRGPRAASFDGIRPRRWPRAARPRRRLRGRIRASWPSRPRPQRPSASVPTS
mmetsp:Transcript_62740/g.180490  ORF Transcript_62740/g.180490 Transcript_62740/m.180490 type:complete len:272 (+) Transcript_62740:427-1242(+)